MLGLEFPSLKRFSVRSPIENHSSEYGMAYPEAHLLGFGGGEDGTSPPTRLKKNQLSCHLLIVLDHRQVSPERRRRTGLSRAGHERLVRLCVIQPPGSSPRRPHEADSSEKGVCCLSTVCLVRLFTRTTP